MKKKVKCNTCHRKNEEKGAFASPWNESLCFKWGTPTCLDLVLIFVKFIVSKDMFSSCFGYF